MVPVNFLAGERMSKRREFLRIQLFSAYHGLNDSSRYCELISFFSVNATFTFQTTIYCGIWGVVQLLILLQK